MRKKCIFVFLFVLFLCFNVWAQDAGAFSLSLTPGVNIPLLDSSELYNIGGSVGLNGKYILPFAPLFHIRADLDFNLLPTLAEDTLNVFSLGAGGGINFSIIPRLGLSIYAGGGAFLGMYRDLTGANPFLKAGLDISYLLDPAFSIGVGSSYSYYFSENDYLYTGVGINLGVTYNIGAGGKKAQIEFQDIEIFPVFPVFCKYYDKNPLGKIVILNKEQGTITDVKISFFVKQYMDRPKVCFTVQEINRYEKKEIPLYALFTDTVMSITEATKVQAEIKVEYNYLGENYEFSHVETLRMYDRNAMTWDDDRKAASFVTAKDPTVLRFSKNITGIVRKSGSKAINLNFRIALGLFEALNLYGINYVTDPKTPFAELSKSSTALDFLQFPRQTLEYKAGDCDDLSILYCAILESIGIETAFIIVPGHIYAAFSLGIEPLKARRMFSDTDDLIFIDQNTWIPVEITMVNQGFLKAWQTGAKEWRENKAVGKAAFLPIHEAWELYEPVGILGGDLTIDIPNQESIANAYNQVLESFIQREIYPQVAKLTDDINRSPNNPKLINKLGVLYANYGLYDKAEAEFKKIVTLQPGYLPALVNMGNIYYLKKFFQEALTYYNRAYQKNPDNKTALLGLARTYYELEKYSSVKDAFNKLKQAAPELAAKYAYLVSEQEETARAADVLKEEVEWDQE